MIDLSGKNMMGIRPPAALIPPRKRYSRGSQDFQDNIDFIYAELALILGTEDEDGDVFYDGHLATQDDILTDMAEAVYSDSLAPVNEFLPTVYGWDATNDSTLLEEKGTCAATELTLRVAMGTQ